MSTIQQTGPTQAPLERPELAAQEPRRRADLDHDLVAILGMVAILALTALCFLARTALPL